MPAVSRVLPWRRIANTVAADISPVVERYRQRWPKRSPELVVRAYEAARTAHEGQRRKTGEAYITHPVAVAGVVADLGLDDTSIAAALLHDAVEDTSVELVALADEFGTEVAGIVDGVTKLDRVRFASKQAQQAATLRKMLVAIANDPRVLMIKLSDRLHNMRTVGALDGAKQADVARETLDIYAPLANRLGMQQVRDELEDLAFAALYPKRYAEIDRMLAERTPTQERFVDQVLEEVREQLSRMKIDAIVTGRKKHHWSVYEKMVIKNRSFDEIFDLVGIRVVVPTIRDAYAALGSIHATWKPVTGRFKDYIAMPKFNLYQSLHTTVVGPSGTAVEVQIRTDEMHQRAEHGVAAHWRYKGERNGNGSKGSHKDKGHAKGHKADKGHRAEQKASATSEADMPWLSRLVEWQAESDDPAEFMRTIASDLGHDEVYVFTPKGDVVTLPAGATPIDFAYAIHTDIGDSLIGAKIDGRLVPLDRPLRSGDTIEAFTSDDPGTRPSRDWLEIAVTPRARSSIRRWFARSERSEWVAAGREAVEDALRSEGLKGSLLIDGEEMRAVAAQFSRADLDLLFEAVGKGDVRPRSVAKRLVSNLRGESDGVQLPARPARQRGSRRRRSAGVHVDGHDDALVRLARCCSPVRGDEVLGFATSGRGISVHRADCANAGELAMSVRARQVEVEWDESWAGEFVASLEVRGLDRNRLLLDVVQVVSGRHDLSIASCDTFVGDDQVAVMQFEVEIGDPILLDQLLAALREVPGVFDAYRAMQGLARTEY
ncbi:RelA/SpoT family protein [Candidatus Poriferisodalis sp.]|uniref:RelA/SpoT family protein n=1 Tax=Candidatus Poriferisodalis sp. TaxID=3101277 RepID=UPI003B01BACC